MALLDTLTEMGFPREKSEKALQSTGGTSLEDAINWIISHPDDEATAANVSGSVGPKMMMDTDVPEESTVEITMDDKPSVDGDAPEAASERAVPVVQPTPTVPIAMEAKSYKCEDCQKLMRTEDEVQFHAAKSGHVNFSESTDEVKPLTEDEKRNRMLALQERLKQKRVDKEEEEKKAAIESEKHRRMTGQQILAAKQRVEEMEMKKISDDKKRQKKEDALTKKRILDQIKLDREAKKQQQGGGATEPKPAAPISTVAPDVSNAVKKDYDKCQLQIRLMNGKVLKQDFGVKEPLSAVRLYVQLQAPDINDPFALMTNFPKRVFTEEDMETPLAELGLVPSAVLIMARKQ